MTDVHMGGNLAIYPTAFDCYKCGKLNKKSWDERKSCGHTHTYAGGMSRWTPLCKVWEQDKMERKGAYKMND